MKEFLKNWLIVIVALIVSVLIFLIPVMLFTYLFGQTAGFATLIIMVILGGTFAVAADITFDEEGQYPWMKR